MTVDKKRYGKDWKYFSRYIVKLAGNRCEFCGVPNRAYRRKPCQLKPGATTLAPGIFDGPCANRFLRDLSRIRSLEFTTDPIWVERLRELYGKLTRIWLTVAHLDHTPENRHRDNLRALCQACHLAYDRLYHLERRRRTRHSKRMEEYRAGGQSTLFADYN